MMKVLFFAKNFEKYLSGYYHDDIVKAWQNFSDDFWIWGPGYKGYNKNFGLSDVLANYCSKKPDLIIVGTSWDDDISESNVNPNENISFYNSEIPVIYYLNKEYKKLEQRLEYIRQNKFSYVVTMNLHWKEYQEVLGDSFKVIHSHFGYSKERFKPSEFLEREYDFAFTGGLHASHNDLRFLVKEEVFDREYIDKKSNLSIFRKPKSRRLNALLRGHKVYWAEWGIRDWKRKSLLPFGKEYFSFLSNVRVFLSTPSADGLINTRFFELLACGTVIICPEGHNYDGLLQDGYNCIMYSKGSFVKTLIHALSDTNRLVQISKNSIICSSNHDYSSRVKAIVKEL